MTKNNNFSIKGFVVWGICAIFFLYEFFLRTVLGTFQHPIMYDLKLSAVEFSIISSTVYLIIYGLMQIPVGLIVDNLGLKKSLLIGAISCAISAFGFASSDGYISALIYRMLMGFGSSFGFLCLMISVYDWMPSRYIAILLGASQFIGTLGPMLAAGPLDSFAQSGAVSWRGILLSFGVLGVVISILIWFFVDSNNQKSGQYVILRRPEPMLWRLKRLFSRTQPWFIAIYCASMYFAIEYLSENEGKHFIAQKGFSSNFASYMISIAWLGYATGCPALGAISDLFQRRKVPLIMAAISSVVAMSLLLYSTNGTALIIAFFLMGIGGSGSILGFATQAEQFKPQFVAVGLGLNNAVIMIISAINAPFIGWLISYSGGGCATCLDDYLFAFQVLLVMSVIGVFLAIFVIKETYCKSQADFTYLNPQKSNEG